MVAGPVRAIAASGSAAREPTAIRTRIASRCRLDIAKIISACRASDSGQRLCLMIV